MALPPSGLPSATLAPGLPARRARSARSRSSGRRRRGSRSARGHRRSVEQPRLAGPRVPAPPASAADPVGAGGHRRHGSPLLPEQPASVAPESRRGRPTATWKAPAPGATGLGVGIRRGATPARRHRGPRLPEQQASLSRRRRDDAGAATPPPRAPGATHAGVARSSADRGGQPSADGHQDAAPWRPSPGSTPKRSTRFDSEHPPQYMETPCRPCTSSARHLTSPR
jgi:hypothetical protein